MLQAIDDQPRELEHRLRAGGDQLLKTFLRELQQFGVANDADGGRALVASENREFADWFAAAEFANHALFATADANGNAQPPVSDDVHAIGRRRPVRRAFRRRGRARG